MYSTCNVKEQQKLENNAEPGVKRRSNSILLIDIVDSMEDKALKPAQSSEILEARKTERRTKKRKASIFNWDFVDKQGVEAPNCLSSEEREMSGTLNTKWQKVDDIPESIGFLNKAFSDNEMCTIISHLSPLYNPNFNKLTSMDSPEVLTEEFLKQDIFPVCTMDEEISIMQTFF
mmetsp:Transcript_40057/g.52726  ORF Transcript_40057/g.52726 Transcript_40057/m.52726 type:complete len:175 (-) Transcript_40057:205-729(-)